MINIPMEKPRFCTAQCEHAASKPLTVVFSKTHDICRCWNVEERFQFNNTARRQRRLRDGFGGRRWVDRHEVRGWEGGGWVMIRSRPSPRGQEPAGSVTVESAVLMERWQALAVQWQWPRPHLYIHICGYAKKRNNYNDEQWHF